MNDSISRSRSTIIARSETEPDRLKECSPPRFAARLINLVSDAPNEIHNLRASPAAARSKSISVGQKKHGDSSLVIAENRARRSNFLIYCPDQFIGLFPIISPSVSKSVAIVTRFAFLAIFWISFTMVGSVGLFIVPASINDRGGRSCAASWYTLRQNQPQHMPRSPIDVLSPKLYTFTPPSFFADTLSFPERIWQSVSGNIFFGNNQCMISDFLSVFLLEVCSGVRDLHVLTFFITVRPENSMPASCQHNNLQQLPVVQ